MKPRMLLAPLAIAVVFGCQEEAPSMAGVWNMTAFRSDNVDATSITGSMTFASNGTLTVNGIVVFPGEPPDTLADAGTWIQSQHQLTMNLAGVVGNWQIEGGPDQVTLALFGAASASRLTLVRQ